MGLGTRLVGSPGNKARDSHFSLQREEDPERFVKAFMEARLEQKELKGGLMGQLRLQALLLDPPYRQGHSQ